jgi:hypothetical protein
MKYLLMTSLLVLASCQNAKFRSYNGEGAKATTPPPVTPQPEPVTPSTPAAQIPIDPADPVVPVNPNGFDIEWSKPLTVWHIGDNNYSDTACKIRIATNRIDGMQFNFNFYVQNDNTRMNIDLYHCGVDDHFANRHPVTVIGYNGNQEVVVKPAVTMPSSENLLFLSRLNVAQQVVLNKGWYKLRVDTTVNPQNNDYDDFVIGKVKLTNVSGPVTRGEVTRQ